MYLSTLCEHIPLCLILLCTDILLASSSSVNCSPFYNTTTFVYPNLTAENENDSIALLDDLSRITNGSYCTEMLNRFLCYLIFPPRDNQSDTFQAISFESCRNYVIDGICAIHVDAMIQSLQNRNMTDIANNLRNCSSPLMDPKELLMSIDLPSLGNMTEQTQCEIQPNSCPHISYDAYAIDIANKPEVIEFGNDLRRLRSNLKGISGCNSFIDVVICLIEFPPCDATVQKILRVCESQCESFYTMVLDNCLNANAEDVTQLRIIFSMYDCSDPGSYLPNVSEKLYYSDNCYIFPVFGNSSKNSSSNSSSSKNRILTGVIIASVLAAVVTLFVLVLGIMYCKYKHRKVPVLRRSVRKATVVSGQLIENAAFDSTLSIGLVPEQLEDLLGKWRHELKDNLIEYDSLHIESEVAKGNFGKVSRGWFKTDDADNIIEVAIKTTKDFEKSAIKSFVDECNIAKKFNHPNVLSLLGISFAPNGKEPLMVMPYMHNGDVKSYLKSKRGNAVIIKVLPKEIDLYMLVRMCLDIAQGMEYLTSNHFVHRDLAARNCMLDKAMSVKVADFGLSRDVYINDYYIMQNHSSLPVKWLAPESLFDRTFSLKTDVWAFGVTCWEIFTFGLQPYPTLGPLEMEDFIKNGGVLDKPCLCSDQMYVIMRSCWNYTPDKRPSFIKLVESTKDQLGTLPYKVSSKSYLELLPM